MFPRVEVTKARERISLARLYKSVFGWNDKIETERLAQSRALGRRDTPQHSSDV